MPLFPRKLLPTAVMFLAMAIAFGVYVRSEKQIDLANDQRHLSFVLANQLRQSSDDLTRMARTYVVTGDPRYKQYYQDILDIRDGRKVRPTGYLAIYWDMVVADEQSPRTNGGQAVALLELMRQAGFADDELRKLGEAKANSDGLTVIELEAMKLVETTGPAAEVNRSRARLMMHDARYHRAKAAVMRPINEFYARMDQRTAYRIHAAERDAGMLRLVFILFVLGAIFTLWQTYAALRKTLGGSAAEVQKHIREIGQGDFSGSIAIAPGMEHSVLGNLSAMQIQLKTHETKRRRAEDELRISYEALHGILETTLDGFWRVDDQGSLLDVNPTYSDQSGYKREELLGMKISQLEAKENAAETAEHIRHVVENGHDQFETRHRRKDGSIWHVEVSTTYRNIAGGHMFVFLRDITARKQAEEELRIAATAFESREGMVITDANSVILRINPAFTEITGYTADDVVGKTPRLLKSNRHDADFYRTMWETINRTGGWQGEVWDRRKDGEEYQKWLTISAVKDEDGAVTHYIGAQYDITERKQAEEKINELAFFDQLTGLPNRTLLMDRLKQTMTASSRSGSYGALLLLDLDKFKTLNDTLGHDMGDLLLQQVAQRLTTCVRAGDTVARLGGDEFVVMLASLSMNEGDAATQTEAVGEKIIATLNQTYQLKDVAYHSTPSIGATLFRSQQNAIDDLLKQADLAMYKSKEAGRNALRFFDPDMERVVMKRAALENDLREAVAERQFLLHYQPQLAGGQLTGSEALVRWRHPRRGRVSPAEFIPLAEETGLILPLGHWVLETACIQLAAWAARPEMAHLTVAVNVSAHQFRQPDFVAQVLAVLKDTGANPQRLKLELTESLLVANVEEIIEKMFALKAKGVGFSLDDFGTGYSSLAYLKRLPLDQLKIDQSFVRDVLSDPNDAAIARTIIALAQSLGLGVIAEGVETEAQRDFLAKSGCHAYQGYFFSRPLPLEGFEEFAQRV